MLLLVLLLVQVAVVNVWVQRDDQQQERIQISFVLVRVELFLKAGKPGF